MMDTLIARFPDQLREAIEIGRNSEIKPTQIPAHIYIAGLGGSGIGGNFAANFVRDEIAMPIVIGKEYDIPNFVNQNTLCFVSSYSGNTEETLAAFELLRERGAEIVCISSGGKLIKEAKDQSLEHIKVPNNWPSPRACLGYSVVQQLYILAKKNLTTDTFINQLDPVADMLDSESMDIKLRAEKIANFIHNKTAVLYSTRRLEPVTVRFRQQINENAKTLCWHHIIPEMNHNELVGWKDRREDLVTVFLRRKDDFVRNQTRIDINKDIVRDLSSGVIEIFAKGKNLIEQSFYLAHLVDWVSWYLSELRGVDAIEVNVIDFLKGELAKS